MHNPQTDPFDYHPSETRDRRRLRALIAKRAAAERAHGVRIRPIEDDAIRALGQSGPERMIGMVSAEDEAALVMYLPDLMDELLEHRRAARRRAAQAVADLGERYDQ